MTSRHWLGGKFNPARMALRGKILNDPYYRFRSLEEIAIAVELGIKINVSQASVDDWLRLPGISIHQSRMLVELGGMGVELLSIEDLAAALSVPVQRIKAIEPILDFSYYSPASLLAPRKLDPSTASREQLGEIAFLTDELTEKILQERQERGLFRDLVDFKQRLSLDSNQLSHLMHFLQFSQNITH